MRSKVLKNRSALLSETILFLFSLLFCGSEVIAAPLLVGSSETKDRQVDQVALHSRQQAIQRLKILIKKYLGSRQESILLMNLAESYQGSADLEFRIAYAQAHQKRSDPKLDRYHSVLNLEVATLSILVSKFGSFSLMDQCLLMRAKAFEELGQKEKAKKDYLTLIRQHAESPRAISAYMALSELAIERNAYLEAVSYLTEVERHPKSSFFPFALYKLAWSYFNLKEISKALSTLERHVRYYDELSKSNGSLLASDSAIRENSLMDFVLFHIEGNESAPHQYPLESALASLRKLERGEFLGRMVSRYAKILRSHRRDEDLIHWKDQLLREEKERPETIEVVTSVFEHQINQEQFDKVLLTSSDFLILHEGAKDEVVQSESYLLARKTLSETAVLLQARLHKDTDLESSSSFIKALIGIYQTLIRILPENDPRVAQSHFNLAEMLFTTRDYERATQSYRWVIAQWNDRSGLSKPSVELKAIASRYEALKKNHQIPEHVDLLPLDQSRGDQLNSTLDPLVFEWVGWIDSWSAHYKNVTLKDASLDGFEFEANRTLYAHKNNRGAVERLIQFVNRKPNSKFAIAAATLVLDTYVKSEKWSECAAQAIRFLEIPWNDSAFRVRIQSVAADALYKDAERLFQEKSFSKLIDQAHEIQTRFPKSPRAGASLLLTAKVQLALEKPDLAQSAFSKLIESFPGSEGSQVALLMRARIAEESYDLARAIQDYRSYLVPFLKEGTQMRPEQQEVYQKLLFLQWVNEGSVGDCRSDDSKKGSPSESLRHCQHFLALSLLQCDSKSLTISSELIEKSFDLANEGPKDNRPLWAAVSLRFDSQLQIRDQLRFLKMISKGWGTFTSLEQLALVSTLSSLIPQAYQRARINLRLEVPMSKVTSSVITRRVEWMKEYESAVMLSLSLPWNRIRALTLLELSGVYDDFVSTLRSLSQTKEVPKDLNEEQRREYQESISKILNPFIARSEELVLQAYQLTADSAVEDVVLKIVSQRILRGSQTERRDGPEERQSALREKIKDVKSYEIVSELGLELIQKLSIQKNRGSRSNSPETKLKGLWETAYLQRNWTKAAYFLQELKSKEAESSAEVQLYQSFTLISAGAKSEGLVLLQTVAEGLEPASKRILERMLMSHYVHSGSVENAIRLDQEIRSLESQLPNAKEGGSS